MTEVNRFSSEPTARRALLCQDCQPQKRGDPFGVALWRMQVRPRDGGSSVDSHGGGNRGGGGASAAQPLVAPALHADDMADLQHCVQLPGHLDQGSRSGPAFPKSRPIDQVIKHPPLLWFTIVVSSEPCGMPSCWRAIVLLGSSGVGSSGT